MTPLFLVHFLLIFAVLSFVYVRIERVYLPTFLLARIERALYVHIIIQCKYSRYAAAQSSKRNSAGGARKTDRARVRETEREGGKIRIRKAKETPRWP